MRYRILLASAVLFAAHSAFGQASAAITPVPGSSVTLTDSFWAPRLETNRTVTLPELLSRAAEAGVFDAFERAALAVKGQPNDGVLPANAWSDADGYKIIEASSWSLMSHPDAALEKKLDDVIALIAGAQETDGYLYSLRTIKPAQPLAAAGASRWVNEKTDSYELYNLGCLIDAAIVHHRATSKTSLINVAKKAADLLDNTFGPAPKQSIWPGHPGIEASLIRLAKHTNNSRYAELAKFMLDQRGPEVAPPAPATAPGTAPARGGGRGGRGGGAAARGPGSTFAIANAKLTDQTQAAGHVASAIDLYRGVAEFSAVGINTPYPATLDKLYDNLVNTKMYITGAPAADNTGVFPRAYNLIAVNAYANTDAAASFIRLNETLFQAKADARYIDALERTLYNALLAGIALDGKSFFETQPLEFAPIGPITPGGRGAARATRRASFTTAYSPLSAITTLARLPELIYAQSNNTIYVNLFAQSTATIKLANNRTIKIDQQASYPWNGSIKFTLTPDQPAHFSLNLRLPAWAADKSVPTDLYTQAPQIIKGLPEPITLKLNGQSVPAEASKGYFTLNRDWKAGETVELSLPMRSRQIQADAQLTDAKNRLALQRGPLVYALEATDNNGKVRNLVLPPNAAIEDAAMKSEIVTNIMILKGKAFTLTVDDKDQPARTETNFMAIPYYAWANRGPAEMTTWIATDNSAAVATSKPTLIATARLSASPRMDGPTNPQACRDGIEPRASSDNSPLSHFDWWPSTNGRQEWVQAEWEQPQTLTSTSVYWWDDTGVGECRPPTSWKALYRDDAGNWQPVPTSDPFGVDKDKYVRINFTAPLKTTAIRLECVMPNSPGTQRLSVGIQEWKIR